MLSGRGLCDDLITRPEESYRLWCVVVCDLENLKNEEAMTRVGSQRPSKKKNVFLIFFIFSFLVLCVPFLFFVFCFLLFCLFFSPSVYSCLFPNFVQVYRLLPPGGNAIAVNKYRIISYVLYFLSSYIDRCWLLIWLKSLWYGMSL